MAYDEELAARLRDELADVELGEKKMFGGLAFLVGGRMAVAVSGSGGLLLRCDPAETEALVDGVFVDRFEMRGKPMRGWLRVAPSAVASDADLARWARIGVAYARTLTPK